MTDSDRHCSHRPSFVRVEDESHSSKVHAYPADDYRTDSFVVEEDSRSSAEEYFRIVDRRKDVHLHSYDCYCCLTHSSWPDCKAWVASVRNRPLLDRWSLSAVDRTSFVVKHYSNSNPNHPYYWPNSAWSHHVDLSLAAMTSAVAVEVREHNHWSQLAYSPRVRWCSLGTVLDSELVGAVSSVGT